MNSLSTITMTAMDFDGRFRELAQNKDARFSTKVAREIRKVTGFKPSETTLHALNSECFPETFAVEAHRPPKSVDLNMVIRSSQKLHNHYLVQQWVELQARWCSDAFAVVFDMYGDGLKPIVMHNSVTFTHDCADWFLSIGQKQYPDHSLFLQGLDTFLEVVRVEYS